MALNDKQLATLISDPTRPIPSRTSRKDVEKVQALRSAYRAAINARMAGELLDAPEKVFDFMQPVMAPVHVERLYILPLDSQNRMIGDPIMISQGDIDGTDASPRAIMRAALISDAASFIVCHNHPSGSINPSHADIAVTKNIITAGKACGCQCLDHVIVSSNGFTSLRRDRADIWA